MAFFRDLFGEYIILYYFWIVKTHAVQSILDWCRIFSYAFTEKKSNKPKGDKASDRGREYELDTT